VRLSTHRYWLLVDLVKVPAMRSFGQVQNRDGFGQQGLTSNDNALALLFAGLTLQNKGT